MMTEHMKLVAWRPIRKGTLIGFASIEIPVAGLRLFDVGLFESNGKRWANLPARPQMTDGHERLDERGRPAYTAMAEFTSRRYREAFSDRVVALVLERDPAAFAGDAA